MPFPSSEFDSYDFAEQNRLQAENGLARRTFLKRGLLLSGLLLPPDKNLFAQIFRAGKMPYHSKRPPVSARTYFSRGLEESLKSVSARIKDPQIAWLFENTYPHILDSQISFSETAKGPNTFIFGENGFSMNLSSSCLQVLPYLHLSKDPALSKFFEGLLRRQAQFILEHPYGSDSFFSGEPVDTDFENWSADSLCYPIHLAWQFWKDSGGNTRAFDKTWERSLECMLRVFEERLIFFGGNSSLLTCLHTIEPGLSINPIRIPLNIMLCQCLGELSEMAAVILHNADLAARAQAMQERVRKGLANNAFLFHLEFGRVYAWEIDQMGNAVVLEHAGQTGWLDLGIRGFVEHDKVYHNTCASSKSEYNAYFNGGKFGGLRGSSDTSHAVHNSSILKSYLLDSYLLEGETDIRISDVPNGLKQMSGKNGFIAKYSNGNHGSEEAPCFLTNAIFSELILRYDRILYKDLNDSKKYLLRESGKFA